MADPVRAELPAISRIAWRFFGRVAARELRRSFDRVRLLDDVRPTAPGDDRPLIVFLNHPSWWDPMFCIHAAHRLLPDRSHYGPIDADALRRYPIFSRLGLFGVARGTRAGARTFLRTSLRVCDEPRAVLWMTPEGGFRDVAERPVELAPGLGHLLVRLQDRGRSAVLQPLALHYPFWAEKRPELLAAFGSPIAVEPDAPRSPEEWRSLAAQRLEGRLDELLEASRRRASDRFATLDAGRSSIHPVYDLMRRVSAWVRGERFRSRHASTS